MCVGLQHSLVTLLPFLYIAWVSLRWKWQRDFHWNSSAHRARSKFSESRLNINDNGNYNSKAGNIHKISKVIRNPCVGGRRVWRDADGTDKRKNKQKLVAAAFEYEMTTRRAEQTALLSRDYYLLKLHLKYLSLYRWPLLPIPFSYPGRLLFGGGWGIYALHSDYQSTTFLQKCPD